METTKCNVGANTFSPFNTVCTGPGIVTMSQISCPNQGFISVGYAYAIFSPFDKHYYSHQNCSRICGKDMS